MKLSSTNCSLFRYVSVAQLPARKVRRCDQTGRTCRGTDFLIFRFLQNSFQQVNHTSNCIWIHLIIRINMRSVHQTKTPLRRRCNVFSKHIWLLCERYLKSTNICYLRKSPRKDWRWFIGLHLECIGAGRRLRCRSNILQRPWTPHHQLFFNPLILHIFYSHLTWVSL